MNDIDTVRDFYNKNVVTERRLYPLILYPAAGCAAAIPPGKAPFPGPGGSVGTLRKHYKGTASCGGREMAGGSGKGLRTGKPSQLFGTPDVYRSKTVIWRCNMTDLLKIPGIGKNMAATKVAGEMIE